MKRIINNIDEMKSFAREFGKSLKGGEVILLNGDLGAGKTTFVRFVLESLGVEEPVSSPSFTIMKTYSNKEFKFFHFDMYRIENIDETYEFGFDEYIQNSPDSVVFIEWAERVEELLENTNVMNINFKRLDNDKRELEIR